MNPAAFRSFLGVLIGFFSLFLLFAKRELQEPHDDAETLLLLAHSQMREMQAKKREHIVAAITQKNNLQAYVDQLQQKITWLAERAAAARNEGDEEGERRLRAEQSQYQAALIPLQASLQSAIETTETIKAAMKSEEEEIRARTAQALSMKSQYKQAQIEWQIEKSRLALTTNYATDLFERAQSKIRQTQARRDLTAQIRKTVEALVIAAESAESCGNEALSRQLLSERDALKEAALNPNLWD